MCLTDSNDCDGGLKLSKQVFPLQLKREICGLDFVSISHNHSPSACAEKYMQD